MHMYAYIMHVCVKGLQAGRRDAVSRSSALCCGLNTPLECRVSESESGEPQRQIDSNGNGNCTRRALAGERVSGRAQDTVAAKGQLSLQRNINNNN